MDRILCRGGDRGPVFVASVFSNVCIHYLSLYRVCTAIYKTLDKSSRFGLLLGHFHRVENLTCCNLVSLLFTNCTSNN
jgi:hypothetical protein